MSNETPEQPDKRDPYKPRPRALFGDVPLMDAMIAWNSPDYGSKPEIDIIPHPDNRNFTDKLGLRMTTGASWTYWRTLTDEGRMAQLLSMGYEIALFSNVPIDLIHEAFWVIPEYRNMWRTGEHGMGFGGIRTAFLKDQEEAYEE